MPRECNIDARGKFVRLVGGSISLFLGITAAGLLMLDVVPSNWFTISSTIGLFAGGALGIYEGRSGWCVASQWEFGLQSKLTALIDRHPNHRIFFKNRLYLYLKL